MNASPEYLAVKQFYGDRRAERSGVLLINHIDQGMQIIAALRSTLPNGTRFYEPAALAGYCLHPLFQNDAELTTVGHGFVYGNDMCGQSVMIAMEYRWRANNFLSDKVRCYKEMNEPDINWRYVVQGTPNAGPIPEVHAALIADKVQNFKDFLRYHSFAHPRRRELTRYFRIWLEYLGVTNSMYRRLTKDLG